MGHAEETKGGAADRRAEENAFERAVCRQLMTQCAASTGEQGGRRGGGEGRVDGPWLPVECSQALGHVAIQTEVACSCGFTKWCDYRVN